jgi:hypothetical protein
MRKETESPNLLAELGYETTDVDVRKVILGIAALFVFIGVSLAVSFGIYKFFEPEYVKVRAKPLFAQARRVPPVPQIQARPKPDLTYYHEATDGELGESIEKAKEAAVAKGISGVREARP